MKHFCFDVAQGRMNGAPNETRTHSSSLVLLAKITPPEMPIETLYILEVLIKLRSYIVLMRNYSSLKYITFDNDEG